MIKKEEIYQHVYKDSKDAYKSIFEYIESWCNRQRTHSSLGYKTPVAVHSGGVAQSLTFGVHFIDLRPLLS